MGASQRRGYHGIVPYAYLNKKAQIWLRIIEAYLILGLTSLVFHVIEFFFMILMTYVSINISAIIRATMLNS